jgi:hypothetical protein
MNKTLKLAAVVSFASLALLACSDDKKPNEVDPTESSAVSSSSVDPSSSSEDGSSSSVASSSSVDGSSSSVASSSSVVTVSCAGAVLAGTIGHNVTLCADTTYELNGYVMVDSNATLTIQAGTMIKSEGKSALFIMPGSKINAVGTAAKPIVFTSKKATPVAGDWAGVVVFGKASVSTTDHTQAFEADASMSYGGTGHDDDSSGVMKYVRIEYAGWMVATDKELNGLTLGGVGSKTDLSYIQVHAGSDDAIEFFGGYVDLDHSVVTAYEDDGWDIDCGWQGKITFGINVQGAKSDRGIEAGSVAIDQNQITEGMFENITMVKNAKNQAIHIKDNVALVMKKSVLVGGNDSAAAQTAELVRLEGDVSIDQVNAATQSTYFEDTFYVVGYAGAYEKDGSGKVIKYYKDANGTSQVCPGGSLPAGAPAGASCAGKVIRDTALETDLTAGLTAGTDLLNADMTATGAAATAGAGAVTASNLWHTGWTLANTISAGF